MFILELAQIADDYSWLSTNVIPLKISKWVSKYYHRNFNESRTGQNEFEMKINVGNEAHSCLIILLSESKI